MIHFDRLDKNIIANLIKEIENKSAGKNYRIMEICGSHTVSISRSGLRSILPANVELISGPGCPVCVTSQGEIDLIFQLIDLDKNLSIITFGDLIKIPSSTGRSLLDARTNGTDVNIIYSSLDAIKIALNNSGKKYLFIAVGFETTAPTIAALIKEVARRDIKNLLILSLCKTMPEAIKYILSDPELSINGFLAPGHISIVTGNKLYDDIIADKRAAVIAGFEPVEILNAIIAIIDQINSNDFKVENRYKYVVSGEPNIKALEILDEVFDPAPSIWRGLGRLDNSGLKISDKYKQYDALIKYDLEYNEQEEIKGCKCGAVLTGKITPNKCPLFGKACNPETPIGPCMVSSEGSCYAYYKYERV